jgi:transposase
MSWQEVTRVSLREEFVQLAMQDGVNKRELCRRFKISPQTGYKWLRRYAAQGARGLEDRSRRPHQSPSRTKAAIEQQVIELRAESRNCWGGRKLSRQLLMNFDNKFGNHEVLMTVASLPSPARPT